MKFGRKSSVLVVLTLAAALLLTAIGTHSIFARASDAAVSLTFPSGFSDPEGVELLSAGENHFLLCGTEENRSFVLLLDENGQVIDQATVSAHMAYLLYCEGNLSLVCPYRGTSKDEFGVGVYTYTVRRDRLDTKLFIDLPQIYVEERNDFDVDSAGRYYALHTPMEETILLFDFSGWLLNQISSSRGEFSSLAVSPDDVLYTLYSDESKLGVKVLPDSIREETQLGEPSLFVSEIPRGGFRFLSAEILIDESGNLYDVQPDTHLLSRSAETGGDLNCAAALSSGRVLVKTGDSRADAFENGERIGTYGFGRELISLAADEDRAVAVVQGEDGWYFVPVTDDLLEEPDDSSQEDSSEESSSQTGESSSSEESSQSSSGSDQTTEIFGLSEAVRIDRDAQKIYLPANTTYAALKNMLRVQNGTLEAQKPNGVPLVSGYVMTGAVLLAKNGSGEVTDGLTAIVPGDLSGTGRLTQTDSKLLYRVLNGTAELDEASFSAADLDGDGQLTTADLLILKKELNKSP